MPAGRPTLYRPEYAEMLIEHMARGMSFESFGGVVKTCRDTLYDWAKAHPEFLDAKNHGKTACAFWWEDQAAGGLWGSKETGTFNTGLWIFNMKNRFQWRDKQPDEDRSPAVEALTELAKLSNAELIRLLKDKEEKDKNA